MSIRFTANDSVERGNNLPTLASLTAMWWSRRQVDTNNYSTQLGWEDGGDFAINQTDSNGDTFLYWSNNDNALGFTPNVTIANGVWRVTAMTFDASKIYAGRSKLLTETAFATAAGAAATSAMTTPALLRIGDFFGGEDFDGDIAGVKIWQAQLTAAEIATEALRISPQRLADLWAFYPMYAGTDRLRDHGPNGYDFDTVNGTLADADMPPVPWGGRAAIIQQIVATGPDREVTADFQLDAPDLVAQIRPIAKSDATIALDAPDLVATVAPIAKATADFALDAPDLVATIDLRNDITASMALDAPDLVATIDLRNDVVASFLLDAPDLVAQLSTGANTAQAVMLLDAPDLAAALAVVAEIDATLALDAPDLVATIVHAGDVVADFSLDAPDLVAQLATRNDVIAAFELDGPTIVATLNAPAKVVGDMQLDAPDLAVQLGGANLITATFDLDAPDLVAVVRPVAGTTLAFGLDAPDFTAQLAAIAGAVLDAQLDAPDLVATIEGQVTRVITASFALDAPDLTAQLAPVVSLDMNGQLDAPDIVATARVRADAIMAAALDAPDLDAQIGAPAIPDVILTQILGTTPGKFRRYGGEFGRYERMRFRQQLNLPPEVIQQMDEYDDGPDGKSYIVLDPIRAGMVITSNAIAPGAAIPGGTFTQTQVENDATFMLRATLGATSSGLLLVLGSGTAGGVTLGVKPDLARFCLAIGDNTFHAELIHPTRFEDLEIIIALSPAQSRVKVWHGQYEAMMIHTPFTEWQDPAAAGGFWTSVGDFVNLDLPNDIANQAATPATVPANLCFYEGQLPISF